MNNTPKKVLIVKISAIGDVIMSLPMLGELRKANPQAKITWVCGKTVAPLLGVVGGVDGLIVIDEKKLLAGGIFDKIAVLLNLWGKLAGRRFDLVVTGHADPRYRLLSLPVAAKTRRSFKSRTDRLWPVPGRHHSDEYARLITNKNGPIEGIAALPRVSRPLPVDLRLLLENVEGTARIALAPGGARNVLNDDAIRRWPIGHYLKLAGLLIDGGYGVVLTGAASDAWVSDAFAGLKVTDMIGKTGILDLISVYGACDLVVTHDSGPLHLAGLAGTPIVALFGPTDPGEKVPRNPLSRVLLGEKTLACRPCYDGRYYAQCGDNLCLSSIDPETVYKSVRELLN